LAQALSASSAVAKTFRPCGNNVKPLG
jgi:hypothetical protein